MMKTGFGSTYYIVSKCSIYVMVLSLLLLLILDYHSVNALTSSQHFNYLPDDFLSSTDGEPVQVFVKSRLANNEVKRYALKTLQDIAELHYHMNKFVHNIYVHIMRQEMADIFLELERNSLIISRRFVKRYFSTNGKAIVESADHRRPYCYYTGKVANSSTSSVSFNLCNGSHGVIEFSHQTFLLKSTVKKGKVLHVLSKQSRKENHFSKCGVSNNNVKAHSIYSGHGSRKTRQVRRPAGYNLTTRYIELYVVMDNSIYRRGGGSVDSTVERALDIANHISVLYKKLNIYIALVGVEVWSDKNQITYHRDRTNPNEYDPYRIASELSKYRFKEINKHTPNDNTQLIGEIDFSGDTIGFGFNATICTRTKSVGVTYDRYEDNYVDAAAIATHEIGHNLGLPHTDENPRNDPNRKTRCQCAVEDERSGPSCLMHQRIGK